MIESKISWKKTLHLPKSAFPARPLVKDRPKYLQRCTDDLYSWQRDRQLPKTFTLHDGPPYANGDLHIGHALNKILKDIICRTRLPSHKVDWRPGWDCHGLPIELKALEQQGERASRNAVSIRTAARKLASKTVRDQERSFRKWSIMADWSNAWTTMDKEYELQQLGVFKNMVKKGLIYRRFRPVHWSPSSRTALADAELEYRDDHVSTAAFVKYPVVDLSEALKSMSPKGLKDMNVVIWTTTPWTLPANMAIGIHQDLQYMIAESTTHGLLVFAHARLPDLELALNEKLHCVAFVRGELLLGTAYADRAFAVNTSPRPLLHANFVSKDSGSGLVHLAPSHGMDDFELCAEHGIMASPPVDDAGCFTSLACPMEPADLLEKPVLGEGNQAVLMRLRDRHQLLGQHQYTHKYPYDWRSKQPVIIRATEQWFANVGDIQDDALVALESVDFIPPAGKKRLQSFTKSRSEWCISRQRAWGVPIPALYHVETKETLLTEDSVSHIMSIIRQRGIDSWWTDSGEDPEWTPPSLREGDGQSLYRRGNDTMDVWFDSGTSWTQIQPENQNGNHVADCYLEGTDQHRGWFQSSLLTRVADQCSTSSNGKRKTAPFKTLITHGFTLDQDGRKMSKSIGNVISPDEIMDAILLPVIHKRIQGEVHKVADAMGPDALRLWVASCEFTADVRISQKTLEGINGLISKYRVTVKLMLGILQDFDPSSYQPPEHLAIINHMALLRLKEVDASVQQFYHDYEFSKAVSEINKFIINTLSATYFEGIKDAVYCGTIEERLQAQGTLYQIYWHLRQMLAPIVPLLIEESHDYTPTQIKDYEKLSPGKAPWEAPVFHSASYPHLAIDLEELMKIRKAVKNVQEMARNEKQMGDSFESYVCLETTSARARQLLDRYDPDELRMLFGVSNLVYVGDKADCPELGRAPWAQHTSHRVLGSETLGIWVFAPSAAKCPRCWMYTAVHRSSPDETLCGRCSMIMRDTEKTNELDRL